MISDTPMKKEKLNWFIFWEMLLCTAMVWFNCSKNPTMASDAFTASFIVLLFVFLKYVFSQKEMMIDLDWLLISIILISFFNVFLSFLVNGESINFGGLKSYFIFISTVIFFRLSEKTKISKKTVDYIFGLNIIISVIYVYCKRAYSQVYSQYGNNALTLNFSNPNLTGMFVFLSLLYMFLGVLYYKKTIMKGICAILAISNFLLLLKTESRNPLVAFVLFLGIFALSFIKINLRFSKPFNLLVNVAPTVFVFLYLTFISKIIEKGWLNFLVKEGKDLNSRVKVWNYFLKKLGDKWLLGDYVNLLGNAHNSHLVLLCSFGFIVLVLVIIFTYKLTSMLSQRTTSKFQIYCLSAFFAVIFMGFGEGALYSGGLGIYILSGGFIVLANSHLEEQSEALEPFV